jgi:hypothetical protein
MLLALAKPYISIRSIAVGEVLYQLVSRTLCMQFCDSFYIHLSFHQFGVVVKGGVKHWFMVFELF